MPANRFVLFIYSNFCAISTILAWQRLGVSRACSVCLMCLWCLFLSVSSDSSVLFCLFCLVSLLFLLSRLSLFFCLSVSSVCLSISSVCLSVSVRLPSPLHLFSTILYYIISRYERYGRFNFMISRHMINQSTSRRLVPTAWPWSFSCSSHLNNSYMNRKLGWMMMLSRRTRT